jgi:hypothetical protein
MEFGNPQQPTLTPEIDHKKRIMLIGGAIFAVSLFSALVAGIFFSTSQNNPTATVTTGDKKTAETTPLPSSGTQNNTANANPQRLSPAPSGATPQYQYIPDPTVDIDKLLPTEPMTPTPTPLPGPFYTANGRQNDLILKLYQREDWDMVYEVQVINTKTTEVRIIGYQYIAAPGDSLYFSKDFSQVIFLGGSKTDYQKITVYSIPQKRPVKSITLDQIRQTLPAFQFQKTATMSRLVLSPDGKKIALSYGNTFNVETIDPATYIVAINLTNNRMQLVPARGLVRNWKDDTTLEYEVSTGQTGTPTATAVQEVKVTGI